MSLEHRVFEIIAEQLGISEEDITSKMSFQRDLGADSLDILELIMAVEEEFEIEVSDSDVEKISTVKELVDYLETNS